MYCGDQHRSTTVTTIQVVQPKPTSLSAIDHKPSSQTQSQTVETQQSNHNLSLSSNHPSEAYQSVQQLSLSWIQPSHHKAFAFSLSGCDFTSSFVSIGRVAFFKVYLEFISGDLGLFLTYSMKEAFLRIIGMMYFQKHRSTFSNYHSPMARV